MNRETCDNSTLPVIDLSDLVRRCASELGRRLQFMEVCGTHTVSFFRSGLRSMLPENVRLISGPGCPVCVTAQRHIDAAIALARMPEVILATYGDMLRVPGQLGSLETARAAGSDVRVVSSARGALELARSNPLSEVVFVAVGFETTAPATAAVILEAAAAGIENFTALVSHKLVVPAMMALLENGGMGLDGFLCPGHVSVVIGSEAYRPVVRRHRKPCVVAGFEPRQMMLGLLHLLRQVKSGAARLENVYRGVVTARGNPVARRMLEEVFITTSAPWRAMGEIPASGLSLAPRYLRFDAMRRFGLEAGDDADPPGCRCGEVIQGLVEPPECPLFGRPCTPADPVGPCMVSSEGTCAAWYRYGPQQRAKLSVAGGAM